MIKLGFSTFWKVEEPILFCKKIGANMFDRDAVSMGI